MSENQQSGDASHAPAQPPLSNGARWFAVGMLSLLYILHTVDRNVISVVIEPLRHEFHLSDSQLGLLGGFAHALAYSAFVLPMGWLLDRTNRIKLLAVMLFLWSTITGLGAVATSYWHLFLIRMGVGAAESSSSPAAQSLIASLFPVKGRSSAMGVVFSGTAIGTGIVFALGGLVASEWGWRWVFLLAGIPGILLAVILWLTVREPPRSSSGKQVEKAPPMRQVVAFVFRSPPILWTTAGVTFASMSVGSVWVWITPVLVRQQHFSLAEAGLIVGFAAGVVKFVATLGSGFLADWIAKGKVNKLWVVPSVALASSVPIAFGIALIPNQLVVVGLVMLLGLTLGAHYAAPKTVIVSVTPENIRGSVASVEQLFINLLGSGIGPFITGAISDYLGGEKAIGLALAATLSINLLAAICFWLAMRGITDEDEPEAPSDVLTASADAEEVAGPSVA